MILKLKIVIYPSLEYYLDFAYMRLAKYMRRLFGQFALVRYSVLFCRILRIHGKIALVFSKLVPRLGVLMSAVIKGFVRVGNESTVGLNDLSHFIRLAAYLVFLNRYI